MTDGQRRAALEGKTFKDLGILLPYLVIPTHLSTLKPLCRYLWTVITDFFLLQFSVKFNWRQIDVALVESPIDAEVPFRPDKSDIYLNFIHFWIEPLTFILKRFGIKRALPHCAEFMKAIGQAYSEAARIYRFRMSTTHRPPPGNNKNLKTIHRLDPHFLCVPSLHIAIIVLTCTFFPAVFKAEGMADDEYQSRTGELYRNGREIAESVLYLKQHSVNCIPAALYMMLHLQSGLFSIEQAVSFINSLFTDADDVTPQGKNKISDHIHYMFDRLVLEGCNEDDWTIPVKRWLINQPLITPPQNKTPRNIP